MKRALLVYPIAYSVLAVALFVNIAGAGYVLAAVGNMINGEQQTIAPPALKCWVSDAAAGPEVRSVRESTMSVERMYWLNYVPGRTIHSLAFMVLFQGVGWGQSPLLLHIQAFSWSAGYGGGTTTPFGVPWWGGNPIHGPAYLVPIVDGTVEWANAYAFTVTA